MINTIAIVADLHCGSRWGLTPPSIGDKYRPAASQWMWRCWQTMLKEIPKLDVLILNGDEIDGKQHRSGSVGLWTASEGEQVDIAIECLKPLVAKAGRVIRMAGTAYHVGHDNPLQALDIALGALPPNDPDGAIVRDIKLDDRATLNVKHQPEGEGTLYRGTALDREALWACITATTKGIPRATHLVRSHLHSDAHLRGFGCEINFTPCWCLQQPYALGKRQYRWVPDIGYTLMRRDKFGFKGWTVTSRTFDIPARKAEVL